jgi:hypothetical protein
MLEGFWITHEIEKIDCDLPTTVDFSNCYGDGIRFPFIL